MKKRSAILMFAILGGIILASVSLVSAVNTANQEKQIDTLLYDTRTKKAIGQEAEIQRSFVGKDKEAKIPLPTKDKTLFNLGDRESLWFTVIFPPTCNAWPTCLASFCPTCSNCPTSGGATCQTTCEDQPTCYSTCEGQHTCIGSTCSDWYTCSGSTCLDTCGCTQGGHTCYGTCNENTCESTCNTCGENTCDLWC